MRDLPAQLLVVLRVYLERGLFALDALAADDEDQMLRWMRLRKAAFYNLLAIDHESARQGISWREHPNLLEVARAVQRINAIVESVVSARLTAAKLELGKNRDLRKNLGKFHSGSRGSELFSKTV